MPLPEFLQPIETEGLNEEYLNAPILQESKSLGALAKQVVDYQRMAGEQLRVPGKDASDDDWKSFAEKLNGRGALESEAVQSQFLSKLGVPEKADDYALKPEKLPDGLEWDDNADKYWRDKFHELKIPKGAGAKLMEAFVERQTAQGEAAVEARQQRDEAVDKLFGTAKDEKLSQIMNAAGVYGDEEAVEFMKTAPVSVVRMMSKIAEQFGVSGDGEFNSRGERTMMSPDEAASQLDEVNKKLSDGTISRGERQRLLKRAHELQAYKLGQKPDLSMWS